MCGIAGYLGKQEDTIKVLLSILEKLEYRGYDSAGLAALCADKSKPVYKKALGELKNLKSKLVTRSCKGGLGIAHTRWATHGKPSVLNAHPHNAGNVFVVHNGIIENYKQIKDFVQSKGYKLKSQTDTEALVALIDYYHSKKSLPFKQAVKQAVSQSRGAFAILAFSTKEPNKMIAVKLSSPLVLGIKENKTGKSKSKEFFLASDALALLDKTKRMVYLSDYDLLELTEEGYKIENFRTEGKSKSKEELVSIVSESVSKGGHSSFMQKEIYEQSSSLTSTIAGRIKQDKAVLGGLKDVEPELAQTKALHLIACGTSYHAALLAKDIFAYLEIPVIVNYASEAKLGARFIGPNTTAIFISQSGETADTLSALKEYKKHGALTLGLTNTVSSSIARHTDAGVYNHAGPEISVASTKAFTSQLAALVLIASKMLELKNYDKHKNFIKRLLKDLQITPKLLEKLIPQADKNTKSLARKLAGARSMYCLGRANLAPVAAEAALKIKEISYIHAEGYPAGELKHGPIALIEKGFPVLVFLPPVKKGKLTQEQKISQELFEKTLSNAEEVASRGAEVFFVFSGAESKKEEALKISKNIIETQAINPFVQPILYAPVLQLLAMHLASLLGHNVDKPRNLAKSVTVE